MRNLIATKPLTYATRRLRAGEGFVTRSDKDARVLVAIRKATFAPDDDDVRAPHTAAGGADEFGLEYLRAAYLQQKGEEPDKRWGAPRLKRELGLED